MSLDPSLFSFFAINYFYFLFKLKRESPNKKRREFSAQATFCTETISHFVHCYFSKYRYTILRPCFLGPPCISTEVADHCNFTANLPFDVLISRNSGMMPVPKVINRIKV